MPIKEDFLDIMRAWNNNESHSDIYHMIHTWLAKYKNELNSQTQVDDIIKRMASKDESKAIVEDFVYGLNYKPIRSEFIKYIS